MKNLILVGMAMMMVLITACKTENSHKMEGLSDARKFPLSIQKGGTFGDLDAIRAQARSIIDFRIQNGDKALSMMTYGYWWPEYVFNAGMITGKGHYDGYWVKYVDDFTYTYGVYDETWGGGLYHYDLEKKELMLLDNDVEQEPKVFEGNYNGDMMSYIGKHTFGVNNGMQMKMVPLDTKPSKS